MRFCFFSWFFKNYELIRDSFLWRSNFIHSVHDSIIIIESGSATYTFGSHFIYKRWVRVSIKIWILAFLGKYSNIFVGFQSVWIEVRIIWYQSTCFKIRFTIPLSFVSCYHPILLILCSLFLALVLWRAPSQNLAPSSKKRKRKINVKKKFLEKKRNRKILFVVSVLSNQNIVFFCPLSLVHCFCNIFLPLVLI